MKRVSDFTLRATLSPSLSATLGKPRPLYYQHGAYPLEDLPSHVRAASSVRRHGGRLVILQDDVNALAVLDPASGRVQSLLLPSGPDGARVFDDVRGTKRFKLDLEASIVLPDGKLVAFGSGSSEHRQKIVTLEAHKGALAQLLRGEEFYRTLRKHADDRGARLNVEGAVVQGRMLRLLQRGSGRRGSKPWNAILDLPLDHFMAWLDGRGSCPPVVRVAEVILGDLGGIPFGFTDGAVTADGRLAFLACVEDTEDPLHDGPALGCRFGWIDADDGAAVMAPVVESDGQPTRLKLEGIEARVDDAQVFDVVADMDDGDRPAEIAELTIRD